MEMYKQLGICNILLLQWDIHFFQISWFKILLVVYRYHTILISMVLQPNRFKTSKENEWHEFHLLLEASEVFVED